MYIVLYTETVARKSESNGLRAFYSTSSVKCLLVFEVVYLFIHSAVFASKQTIPNQNPTTTGAAHKFHIHFPRI